MTNEEVAKKLNTALMALESELEDWFPNQSNQFVAYGPNIHECKEILAEILPYFESHAKFEKELAEAYNEGWPDFVDGDIL